MISVIKSIAKFLLLILLLFGGRFPWEPVWAEMAQLLVRANIVVAGFASVVITQ
jgi:hypothetical protein